MKSPYQTSKSFLSLCAVVALISLTCSTAPAQVAVTPLVRATAGAMHVRTTAYTAFEANGGGLFSAVGNRLRYGGSTYSAASDWSWLPLGTVFRMRSNGRTYVIEDYGSALVGRKTVDLYKPNMRVMRAWGVRHEAIEVLKLGSFEKSLAILEPRQRYGGHVRRMVAALRKRQGGTMLLASNQTASDALTR